ncbi:cbb3-type cytochrome c oxidase subunit 3 [Rhodovulum euryhalinum]|uniref:Cytochrome c oxidase cbb3-type subunit 4 n=1 Tax=Rhodovulum euryhalinum TaxID=35805 RepID=A0A4R2KFW5_9RHOB|nr:cbb3-type cytochrome c oxidase subunit 3 [Rhodovulum euryhalinum]TCO71974.1 cytochrome c oxidase cbb3-type subunit 4 [Rhodovulum euryhalinum]
MDTYSVMREFADSWMLLFLTLFFVGVIVWVLRPGSTKAHRDSASIPFRHEDEPAGAEDDGATCRKEART